MRKSISYELALIREFGSENLKFAFFSHKVKKKNKEFSTVNHIDFSLYSIIKMQKSRYSEVNICQQLGIQLTDYEQYIVEGIDRGIFNDSGILTTWGQELYLDAKKCIRKNKRKLEMEFKSTFPILKINYKPKRFNGRT